MEQSMGSAAPLAASGKSGKGAKIFAAVASIVALAGIGFGVYGMIQANNASNKDLKIEDVYANYSKKPIPEKKTFLSIHVVATVSEAKINGKDYKNVNVLSPLVKYMFRDN